MEQMSEIRCRNCVARDIVQLDVPDQAQHVCGVPRFAVKQEIPEVVHVGAYESIARPANDVADHMSVLVKIAAILPSSDWWRLHEYSSIMIWMSVRVCKISVITLQCAPVYMGIWLVPEHREVACSWMRHYFHRAHEMELVIPPGPMTGTEGHVWMRTNGTSMLSQPFPAPLGVRDVIRHCGNRLAEVYVNVQHGSRSARHCARI